LLWEGNFANLNFEGITLGPPLDNGDYSLILVSDNGGGLGQSLYALRITGVIPEPGTAALVVMGMVALVVAGRRLKQMVLGVRR
jgi:hypothetical protein